MRANRIVLAGVTVGLLGFVAARPAAAEMPWLSDFDVDPQQYLCLSAAIYNGTGDIEQATPVDDMERIAWVLKNRTASDEFAGSYCAMAEELAKPDPFSAGDAAELVRAVMRAETGTETYERAKRALETYRANLVTYRSAQIAAYKLIAGWFDEDPTDGSTALEVETVEGAESG